MEGKQLLISDKIKFILDNVEESKTDIKMLILIYWQLFDKIDIPEDVLQSILVNGTNPDTLSRQKREILSVCKNQIIESIKNINIGEDGNQ